MKILLIGFVVLVSTSSFADISSLKDSKFKAANCDSCEVEFYSDGNLLKADMINWGSPGETFATNLPVSYDNRRNLLSIKNNQCVYEVIQDSQGIISKLDLVARAPECPETMTRLSSIPPVTGLSQEQLYKILENHIWAADTCSMCEVEFKTSNEGISADMVNWRSYGVTYASNLPVRYDNRRKSLSIKIKKDRQCMYQVVQDSQGILTKLIHVEEVIDCPRKMTIKY